MKKFVKGYNLLKKSGLHDYLMEYLLLDGNHVELVAKEPHGIESLKLQFENVEEFFIRGDGGGIFGDGSEEGVRVVSIIFDIEMKKLDANTMHTKIETSYGAVVYVVSGKLTVTKV